MSQKILKVSRDTFISNSVQSNTQTRRWIFKKPFRQQSTTLIHSPLMVVNRRFSKSGECEEVMKSNEELMFIISLVITLLLIGTVKVNFSLV